MNEYRLRLIEPDCFGFEDTSFLFECQAENWESAWRMAKADHPFAELEEIVDEYLPFHFGVGVTI